MSDEEAAMLATLRPCVDGPITSVAAALLETGRHGRYASTRALAREVIDAHKTLPVAQVGRPLRNMVDRQAELLNRLRATRGKLNPAHAKRTLRHAFPDLTDSEFDAATCAKPTGRIVRRANEIKGAKSSCTVSRLDSDDDLTSDHVQPAT